MTKSKVHQPCPFKECGSSDAFNYDSEGFGFCQSCKSSYPPKDFSLLEDNATERYPLKERKKNMNIKDIKVDGATYEGIRGIDPDVCAMYGIQLHTVEGKPVRYAFKYPNNVKYRGYELDEKGKKVFQTKENGVKMRELFGPEFNAGTSNRIYLTEGEFDAASLYQILGKQYPVKSLPSSSINMEFIKHNYAYLSSFKEIVYAGELDKAGRPCAEMFYEAFPEKLYFVPMSKHKDANEFLMAGDGNDLMWAARKPQRYTPDNFFCSDEAVEEAILTENPYEYVPTGHSGWDERMRGLVKGGLTFIKAPRGTGKTEMLRYFEYGLIHGNPTTRIAALHMEEMKSTTYRGMATYELGVNVRTKDDARDNGVTEEEVIAAAKKAAQGERTILFELRAHDGPKKVEEYIRLAAKVYGAEFIFVDHVQRLAYLSQEGVDGATAMLTALGAHLAQLAKELNIGIVLISQVNDDGRTKYAAALEEEAIICVKLERDTESEDEVECNTTYFTVDKNRPFSKLGSAGSVYFEPETTILREFY